MLMQKIRLKGREGQNSGGTFWHETMAEYSWDPVGFTGIAEKEFSRTIS